MTTMRAAVESAQPDALDADALDRIQAALMMTIEPGTATVAIALLRAQVAALSAQGAAERAVPAGYVPVPQAVYDALLGWYDPKGDSMAVVRPLVTAISDMLAASPAQPAPRPAPGVESNTAGATYVADYFNAHGFYPSLRETFDAGRASHGQAPAPSQQESNMAAPAQDGEREAERAMFKDAHRHLELDEVPDAWGRPMFKHSHVEASWLGWIARAARAAAPAAPAQPGLEGERDLPKITAEDRSFLHYNPNTDDIVKWVHDYAKVAIDADRAARAAAPVAPAPGTPSEAVKFSDTSTASPIEKTKRYLQHLANKKPNNPYFFDDGYPRESIADDAAAALAVFEQLAAPQPATADAELWPAARDVLSERRRQVSAEGWTRAHDDKHSDGSLAAAAACYAIVSVPSRRGEVPVSLWPKSWAPSWWKPSDPRRNLIKAGALILAELERIDRAALAAQRGGA
ncbi:hypothetical protein KW843_22960 [Acidovorax sp. sif1233]|uniref:hypothetical protein n=1 Tax=Acidovorax sp. sif1233 TaxID=2854792 RepID=UPI001C438EA7|nr:hypothetical protein [Acidovorax sp. sif1233]MBV7457359.1 hypothetical protein [Acidovorax sp. sif1233]